MRSTTLEERSILLDSLLKTARRKNTSGDWISAAVKIKKELLWIGKYRSFGHFMQSELPKLRGLSRRNLVVRMNDDKERKDVVYFVQGKSTRLIKIGFTVRFKHRLSTLRIGSPDTLIVLASMPGTKTLEKKLHKRFRKFRSHGEWFRPSEELVNFIKSLHDR